MANQESPFSEEISLVEKIRHRCAKDSLEFTEALNTELHTVVATRVGKLTVNFMSEKGAEDWLRFWVRFDNEDVVDLYNPATNRHGAAKSKYGLDHSIYTAVNRLYKDAYKDLDAKRLARAHNALDELD